MTQDHIHIHGASSSWRVRRLAERQLKALRQLKQLSPKSAAVVSISFVDARKMTQLNRKYRRKSKVTDVLSFEQPQAAVKGVVFLGDLVICIPVLKRQARAQGHGVQEELAILLTHGLLHLLGHDHERSAHAAKKMAGLEQRLLSILGGSFAEIPSGLIQRSKV